MGMTRAIQFDRNGAPDWTAVRTAAESAGGRKVEMRMVDGMPAFPDEEPESNWRELRVSLGNGMLTVRRIADGSEWQFVVWGNAEPRLTDDVDLLMRSAANVGVGGRESKGTAC